MTTNLNLGKLTLAIFVMLVMTPILVIIWQKNDDSGKIMNILHMIYFIPTYLLYGLCDIPTKYELYVLLYEGVLLFLYFVYSNRTTCKLKVTPAQVPITIILVSTALIVLYSSGKYGGFDVSFDLTEYVEKRLDSRKYSWSILTRYVISNAYFLLPIGAVYSFFQKNRAVYILLFAAQIFLFSLTGKKSSLFLFLFAVALCLWRKKDFNVFFGLNIFNAIAVLDYYSPFSMNVVNVFQRRFMFIPALLGTQYYDWIQRGHELLLFRQSVLGKIGFHYQYEGLNIQQAIGLHYYNNIESNANTGLCGDAFVNLGWGGWIIFPILISAILFLCNKVLRQHDIRVRMMVWICFAYVLCGQSFFTCLISSGIIITLIVLYLGGSKFQHTKTQRKILIQRI